MLGQDTDDNQVGGGSRDRIRRERYLRRLQIARLRGWERNGFLRRVQHLRPPGLLWDNGHPPR